MKSTRTCDVLTVGTGCGVLARSSAGLSQNRICLGPGHGLVPSSGHLAYGFNVHGLNLVFIDELQEMSGSFGHCFVVSCVVSLIGAVDWEKYGHRRLPLL